MTGRVSRRQFLSAASTALVAAMLQACGGATEAPAASTAQPAAAGSTAPTAPAAATSEQVTLTMWDNNAYADLAKGLDEIMSAYEQVQPKVKLKLVHNQDLPKTLTAISAGTGPDIVWLWDGSEPIGTWAENGIIAPLDQFIASSKYDINTLVPAAVNTVTYRGKVYGLPLVADAYWLWWNKAVFKDAGLDPEKPPQTIADLWAVADKLTKQDGDRITQLGMGLPSDMPKYQTWAYAFGADFYDPEAHKLTVTSPDMQAAMNDIAAGYKKYGPDRVSRFTAGLGQGGTAQDPFLQGKIAMKLDGDWIIQYIRDYKPDWKYPQDYGVAALPWAPGKEKAGGSSNVLRTYPLAMMQNSKLQQQAWDFISWLQSADVTVKIAKYLINLPQSKAALSDTQLTSVAGFGKILEEFRTSQNIKSLPAMPASAEFADEFQKQLDVAFHGQETVEAALQGVTDKIQPVIDKVAK